MEYLVVLGPDKVHRVTVQGLQPGTEYQYGLAKSTASLPAFDTIGRLRTWREDRETTLRVGAGSCAGTGSKAPGFDDIAAAQYDLFLHMGDMHYSDIVKNDPALFRDAFDIIHASEAQRRFFQSTAVYYMWDDHDFGPDD